MTTSTNPLAGRRFVDESGNPVVPGRKLGEGGEGVVHLVDDDPGAVVKIWHPGKTPDDADAKIRHLVGNPVTPDLGVTWHITWPQHEVRESGIIVGYTMPTLNPGESWEPIVEYYNRRAAQGTGAAQAREIQLDDRVRMARNLALGFRAVHDAGYVIGDVNEKNVEVNRQNDIAMVDCDSYGFTDLATGRTFSNNMGRPEFQAPEAQGDYANRTQNHDRFGLAVVIFHLLTGYHPYTVTNRPDVTLPGDRISAWLFPPADPALTAPDPYNDAWERLTDQQKELFLRSFDRAHQGDPRPTPEEWVEALMEMPAVVTPPTPASSARSGPTSTATTPASPGAPAPAAPRTAPGPRRYYTPPASIPATWPLLVSAVIGYGALIPLFIFNEFRPWLWLSLMLVSAAFFYFPVRRLFEAPVTRTRWIIIGVAAFPTAWFLLGLIGAALSVWPWWLWLGAGMAAAFVFLIPARSAFGSPNVWRRRAMVGAASLVALLILGGLGAAGFREWQDWNYERSLSAATNTASASNIGAPLASGNAVNDQGGASVAASASAPVIVPTATPASAPAAAVAPPAEPVCGRPTNFRAGAFNAGDRSLIYSWDAPARSDLTVTGYQTESREARADGTYTDWGRRDPLGAGEIYQAVGPFSSEVDGRTFQNRVYALCDSVHSEPSEHVPFTYPAPVAAVVPTDPPAPAATDTPVPAPTPTPEPLPTATPAPTATPLPPTAAPPLQPTVTLTPHQRLVQHPAHPKITNASQGTQVLLQGCYLGNQTAARRFRLASWDVWDPGRYGAELKFVQIITSTGAQLPLERGACYSATVIKQVDSPGEYVCLDQGATHSLQSPCGNYRENEVIPTFILYPDGADDYSRSFYILRTPTPRPPGSG